MGWADKSQFGRVPERLFHAFPMKFTSSTERRNCSPRLLVPRKGLDGSLLIGSDPARPHSAFDVLDNYAVRYRVCAKESEASVYDCFVFVGRALHPVVGCEFRKIRARDNDREAAIVVEYRDALRIWAKWLNRTAVWSDAGIQFETPGPDQVLGGLADGIGNGNPQACGGNHGNGDWMPHCIPRLMVRATSCRR